VHPEHGQRQERQHTQRGDLDDAGVPHRVVGCAKSGRPRDDDLVHAERGDHSGEQHDQDGHERHQEEVAAMDPSAL
jgi:hypothetical protein